MKLLYIRKIKMTLRWIFWILVLLIVFCVWFYRCYFLRQPLRKIPNNENVFVSPANGEIIAIIKNPTDNTAIYKDNNRVLDHFIDWIGSGATMVSIMMTPANVHYQRSPNNATLIEQVYVHWKKRNAMKTDPTMKSTLQNEYNAMLFESDNWVRYRIVQIAWTLARRIVSYVDIDDELTQWEIIWLIKFWSQVTIIFDKNVEVIAKVWDKVIDWETVLAKMK
jgi:phosphatidylserine decarboxylase